MRNAQKVLEWAGSARDDWQVKETPLMHRHFVRILDYLDGSSLVQKDAPGEPLLVAVLPSKIGLLNLDPSRQDSSFLYMIDYHLNAMIQSPNLTPTQRKLAAQIDKGVKNITVWLEKVHQDARQLVKMSGAQLAQASTLPLLDDMALMALDAFVGHIDPSTGGVQDGAIQVHYNNQRLAIFDVAPYKE